MYGIPQTRRITHYSLVQHLEPHGCLPLNNTLVIWTHDSLPINFTLVINDFGVKYSGKEHALHIKSALEAKYKVTPDWDVKLYVRISIKWDYVKGTVQLSMSGYVRVSLHQFQQEKAKREKDSPYPWALPQFVKNNQIINNKTPAE